MNKRTHRKRPAGCLLYNSYLGRVIPPWHDTHISRGV